ncbi:MAG: sigma-70 family RNA polymerase sigma factor [Bryobacteraceae bacterium]
MFFFLFPLLSAVLRFADDSDLVRRLKQRDPQAMADLYDRYGRLTYSIVFRVVHNAGAAEDLVQETFFRIWNRVQAFDERKGALGPWILTVARNRAIDYLRSIDGRMNQSAVEIEKLESPGMFSDLESEILNLDRVRVLREAFQKLNPNQRIVIELAYYEGLSQTEMAERMKQPLGTVKTWVRSALKVLRDELGEAITA